MARQTAFEWLIEKLSEYDSVAHSVITSANLLTITRVAGPDLTVTKAEGNHFDLAHVEEILKKQSAEFILHVSKDPFIDGKVYEFLDRKRLVMGGFGDVMNVANQSRNWPYTPRNVGFILRGLQQHSRVRKVTRLDSRRYKVYRIGLEDVVIIGVDDYDIGTESIRDAVDRFDAFDAIFKANPNGRILTSALQLADSRQIKVFTWAELLGKLNQKWNWKQ